MPRLPIYTSQGSVSGQQSGAREDVGAAGLPGRALQQAGGALRSLGDTIDRIGDKWDKAKATNQYTTAKNATEIEMDNLMAEVAADEDHSDDRKKEYLTRLEEIKGREVEIDDEDVKAQFNSNNGVLLNEARIKIDGAYKRKMLGHQLGQLVLAGDIAKKTYIGGTVEQRKKARADHLDLIETNFKNKIIDEKQYLSEKEEMDGWEIDRAKEAINNDATTALEDMQKGEFDLDGKERSTLIKLAKDIINENFKIATISTLSDQADVQGQFTKEVLENSEMSTIDKLKALAILDTEGKVSDKYEEAARRRIRYGKVDDVSKTEAVISTRQMIADVHLTYNEGGSAEEFLRGVHAIQEEILSNPDLSDDDRAKLQSTVQRITSKDQATASSALEDSEGYQRAANFFKRALPSHMRSEALRRFFNEVDGKNLSPAEYQVAEKKITSELMQKASDDTKDSIANFNSLMEKARSIHGEKADIRDSRDENGNLRIILYKDGRAVQNALIDPLKKTKGKVK